MSNILSVKEGLLREPDKAKTIGVFLSEIISPNSRLDVFIHVTIFNYRLKDFSTSTISNILFSLWLPSLDVKVG
jgi:hypothetical protein